jgi:NACalpha-BTF3-like transcription factor
VEADVLQVAELEVSKQKATELLRANDGDAVKAMKAFVTERP